MKIKKIISLLLCFALAFAIAGCGNTPAGNVETANNQKGRVVITRGVNYVDSNDENKYHSPGYDYPDISISRNEIFEPLKQKLIEYKGMDVWFRVNLFFENSAYYDQLALEEGTDDKQAFMEKLKAEEIDFAKSIGAMNVMMPEKMVSCSNFGENKYYYMELTAEMIDKLFERNRVSLDLAPPQRIEGYSDKISDILTTYLEKMNDTDTLEVAAVTIYDAENRYAIMQNIGANAYYNSQYFKLMVPDTEMLSKKEIIAKTATITNRLKLGYKLTTKNYNSGDEFLPEDAPVGFNAILTKAEILKIAEDSEIKVIYVANA